MGHEVERSFRRENKLEARSLIGTRSCLLH